MDRVAVVILNYNGVEMLRRFLPLVIEYTKGARVIVADNASTDTSLAVLAAEFPSVEVIALDENYGFAGGYNRALDKIDAEYFLLLNSDVEVTENWLQPLLRFMDARPSAVACQPKLLSYNDKQMFEYAGASGGFIDKYGYPFCRGRIFDTVEKDCGQYDDCARLFWATGAALMVRSSAYRSAGGLDEKFFAHMEEIDLCWRMVARGGEIYAVPQSKVYHVGGATLAKSNPRKTYLNFRNNLLMLYKNLPAGSLCRIMTVRAVLDYVAAFKFLLSGEWGNFKAVLRARCHYRKMKKEYKSVRAANLSLAKNPAPHGMTEYSILWRYYARGNKCFSEIPVK